VRRFRAELLPWQQKMLTLSVMPGPGRKAQQLNWGLRPEFLHTLTALGGFQASGATEDSTLGYALGARGILMAALRMLDLNDLRPRGQMTPASARALISWEDIPSSSPYT